MGRIRARVRVLLVDTIRGAYVWSGFDRPVNSTGRIRRMGYDDPIRRVTLRIKDSIAHGKVRPVSYATGINGFRIERRLCRTTSLSCFLELKSLSLLPPTSKRDFSLFFSDRSFWNLISFSPPPVSAIIGRGGRTHRAHGGQGGR